MVIPGYTHGVKTAVSIPDPLFDAADRLARRRRMSRSALYAEALELLLEQHADDDVTARLNELYAEVDSSPDPFLQALTRRMLESEEW
jgi:predicted transcriptional regulator